VPTVAAGLALLIGVKLGSPLWLVPAFPRVSTGLLLLGGTLALWFESRRRSLLGVALLHGALLAAAYLNSRLLVPGRPYPQHSPRDIELTMLVFDLSLVAICAQIVTISRRTRRVHGDSA
jgi:hypothetical protein